MSVLRWTHLAWLVSGFSQELQAFSGEIIILLGPQSASWLGWTSIWFVKLALGSFKQSIGICCMKQFQPLKGQQYHLKCFQMSENILKIHYRI